MTKEKKQYQTIIADPPWDIQQKGSRGAERHYKLMTLDQIKNMPVADLADTNSHCWLWATGNTLRHAFDVLEAWGFQPKSVMTYIKFRLGLGNYLRSCTEFCLLGTRGRAPILCKNQQNWLPAPVLQHSEKPREFHEVVMRCSPGPNRLELFARRPYPGFDIWGDKVVSDLSIEGYPVPKIKGKD
jgi:N6-adenosine-specific RNA methylase IME4